MICKNAYESLLLKKPKLAKPHNYIYLILTRIGAWWSVIKVLFGGQSIMIDMIIIMICGLGVFIK